MRILVVDDDRILRQMMVRALEKDHDVVDVDNGSEALRQMYTNHFDVMLLDLRMETGLSGWDVAKVKLSDPDLVKIPLVIVTALDVDEARSKPLGTAVLILSKPFTKETLLKTVSYFDPTKKNDKDSTEGGDAPP